MLKKLDKKIILVSLSLYLVLGLFFGVMGEMRLARKYAVPYSTAFANPWLYIRATVMAPFWPLTLALTVYDCHNMTGCPIDEGA